MLAHFVQASISVIFYMLLYKEITHMVVSYLDFIHL